jgi:hypothetical protein
MTTALLPTTCLQNFDLMSSITSKFITEIHKYLSLFTTANICHHSSRITSNRRSLCWVLIQKLMLQLLNFSQHMTYKQLQWISNNLVLLQYTFERSNFKNVFRHTNTVCRISNTNLFLMNRETKRLMDVLHHTTHSPSGELLK